MKGITKSVSIQFVYSNNKFDGKLLVDRTDFGVGGTDYSDSIGEKVKVKISCVVE